VPELFPKPKIGTRYGRLVITKVITTYHINKYRKSIRTQYECKCDCGNVELLKSIKSLRTNHKGSCGCLHKEGIESGKFGKKGGLPKGHRFTNEQRQRMGQSHIGSKRTAEQKIRMKEAAKKARELPEVREKYRLAALKAWKNPIIRNKQVDAIRRGNNQPNVKKTRSRVATLTWKDPKIAAARLLHRVPNNAETRLTGILDLMFPGEYQFVGNGEFILDGLNPDFVNINGQKKVIELFGEHVHDPATAFRPVPVRGTAKVRKEIFSKFGYQTLIVWFKELKDLKKLRQRIKRFHNA
jgi:hypothetical protein